MEVGLLVQALDSELSIALNVVDGFLGQINVEHEIMSADYVRVASKI